MCAGQILQGERTGETREIADEHFEPKIRSWPYRENGLLGSSLISLLTLTFC